MMELTDLYCRESASIVIVNKDWLEIGRVMDLRMFARKKTLGCAEEKKELR